MFPHDNRGRITGASPLVHILRTPDAVVVRCHASLPDDVVLRIEDLAAAPRARPSRWAEDYARFMDLVGTHGGIGSIRSGMLYGFPGHLPEAPDCILIHRGNAQQLASTLPDWIDDAEAGRTMAAALVGGKVVSVCASVRETDNVHCAGVETTPEFRGQGLAGRAVSLWARNVRETGAEPYYATTFDNIGSQKVAGRLGLNMIGSEFSISAAD
ncbi:GNAT family N-acetyltransferase [Phenylobacterium sp.]|nr:GNAT family N-acetyltransferase [Phenylobacterium sp.]MCA6346404.1 GNAT family N-acetyltransferase [Phenylobacterium sp.]MCA6349515.1 GNAT family N-acetyltransferase [Phenylobacterium sp.]MCA6351985.1 GNAT family N-acetyltransferase [Phenylobacterium sp.]